MQDKRKKLRESWFSSGFKSVFARAKSGKSWYGKPEKPDRKARNNRTETEKRAKWRENLRLQGSKTYLTDGRTDKKPKTVEAEKPKKARKTRFLLFRKSEQAQGKKSLDSARKPKTVPPGMVPNCVPAVGSKKTRMGKL